jgi:glycosyltransferase involved in cell wall biosynthesis
MRILQILATWVPPSQNWQADRFVLLSEHLEGDILHPVSFRSPEEVEAEFGPGSYSEYTRGRFHYHWFLAWRYDGWRRRLATLYFYLRKGLELHRKKRYDCIVVYSHMLPALVAIVLKLFTGAKLIVEIMTSPHLSYLYEHPERTLSDRVLRLYSHFSLYVSVLCSDRVHLLYPTQLKSFPLLSRVPASVFHDFVPLSVIRRADGDGADERVVLLIGAPWFLKGADLLIAAFREIAEEFPDVTLRLQGYYPGEEGAQLEALVAGCPRIQILKAVPHPETLRRISQALILAHPSRCDGLARVLIEAMASAVPAIASDAGGNSFCIRDGETGLVFPSGNVPELSRCLRQLLGDAELRKRLGSNGYQLAHTRFTEQVYVDQFAQMVQSTVRGGR